MNFRVDSFTPNEVVLREAAAKLLVDEFRLHWPEAWPTLEHAREEVAAALVAEKIALAACAADGSLVGWVGAQPTYGGNVWELHPMVVAGSAQRHGIGRALVAALEQAVRERDGLTLWLGTDDEANLTTLGGADIYPNVLARLADIRNLHDHPFGFYRKVGFEIVGVVPDANGFGKPDILMAKRIARR